MPETDKVSLVGIPIPIVVTKLHPPVARGSSHGRILQRRRLLDALDAVPSRKLTLICAGPGHGKTTLLSALISLAAPVVWYSLGPSDRDLTVFVSYLVEGIRRHHPEFGESVLRLLSAEQGETVNPIRVAAELVNNLSDANQEMVIVLDDYHYAERSRVTRKAVDFMLAHLPEHVHLVIATRQSPSLPCLARLRMIGEVNEIVEADLRFTPEEVHDLFDQVYSLRLSAKAVGSMVDQTEGWIIALQLAAQSLKAKSWEEHADFLASMGAGKRRLFEYLAEEVFQREPAAVQQFLTESSILSSFSAESGDAILGRSDTAAMLGHIERNNLFAVEVVGGNWRYHHLFRDFLRQLAGRDPQKLNELHRRAGSYYQSRGDHEPAVHHFLAGADYERAMTVIGRVGRAMLISSRFDTLTFWIGQIPDGELFEAPEVLLLQAEVFRQQGRYDGALQLLDQAGQAFAAKRNDVGLAKVLCGKVFVLAFRSGRHTEAQNLYRQALDCLGDENKLERADLLASISLSYMEDGNPSAALESYREALRIYEGAGDKERILALLLNPGVWLRVIQGDFEQGYVESQRALDIAEQLGSKHRLGECLAGMSLMLRYLDRCDAAREYALRAMELSREVGCVEIKATSLLCLSLASQGGISPDLESAKRYTREAAHLGESEGFTRGRIWARIHEVSILRKLGDLDGARRVGEWTLAKAEGPDGQSFKPSSRMNFGAVLIGQDNARAEALLLLARDGFKCVGDKFNLGAANFWLAALHYSSSPRRGLEYLKASLEPIKAHGYGWWLREERDLAVPLLRLAIEHDLYPDYCTRLLKSMDVEVRDAQGALIDGRNVATVDEIRQPYRQPIAETIIGASLDGLSGQIVLPVGVDPYRAAPRIEGVPLLRICCFGGFRVYVGERMVRESEWQGKRAKRLVKYLATSEGHAVPRDCLMEVFWGDLRPEGARLSLRQTLHLGRRALEPNLQNESSTYILANHDCLFLNPDLIDQIDVDVFTARVAAGEKAERAGDLGRAAQEYNAAQEIYTGDFLADDLWDDWAVPRRDRFRTLNLAILHKLANWRINVEDYEGAIAYLRRMLDLDCTREDIHATLIRCFAKTGRRQEAQAQYATCRAVLRQEFDLEPCSETRELHASLKADRVL